MSIILVGETSLLTVTEIEEHFFSRLLLQGKFFYGIKFEKLLKFS